jgi:hypothetical protein
MGRTIIAWSGGADSTALLDHYAGVSSEDYPVYAVSVCKHPNLNERQLFCEDIARGNYLGLAKERGYWIEHLKIEIGGDFDISPPVMDRALPPTQMWLWLSVVSQVVGFGHGGGDGDRLLLAYIRGDVFWHFLATFRDAFYSLMKLKGLEAELLFPFEWETKEGIFRRLKTAKIPYDCWWSCDNPRSDYSRCGRCKKCIEQRRHK